MTLYQKIKNSLFVFWQFQGSAKLFRRPFFVYLFLTSSVFTIHGSAQACRLFQSAMPEVEIETQRRWNFNHEVYGQWVARWRFLNASGKSPVDALRESGEWRPEAMIAFLDSLQVESGLTLVESLREIEGRGDGIEIRRFRFSRSLQWQGFRPVLERKSLDWKSTWIFGLNRKLVIYVPRIAPRTIDEFAESLRVILFAVTQHRLKRAARRAPLVSVPVGASRFSYPQSVMDIVLDSSSRLYSGLLALERFFPRWEPDLPLRDRTWRFQFEELTFTTIWRFFFPFFYDPLKKSRPNDLDYQRFQRDLANWIESGEAVEGLPLVLSERFPELNKALIEKFKYRSRLKWAADRWRDYMLVTALVGVVRYAPAAYEYVASGEIQRVLEQIQDLQDSAKPENLNRALLKYEGTLAWKYYGPKIEALEKDIKENGDFNGSKRKELASLIEKLEKFR